MDVKLIFLALTTIFLVGCSSYDVNKRKVGIVDAVWTTMEIEKDKQKVEVYLTQKEERKELSFEEKNMIIICVDRAFVK